MNKNHRPKISIIAHRGRTSLVRSENTIEAFRAAIEIGVPHIEFDLRRTQDGQIVCFHDESIDGIKLKHIKYDRLLTIAETKGFAIPLFEEALELCCGKIGLDIEIKETGYEDTIVSIALKYLSYSEFVMKSFNDSSVRAIKSIDPNIKIGLLVGRLPPQNIWHIFQVFPEYRILRTGADFVSPNYRLLRLGFLWRMNRLGKEVYVWTVNRESRLVKSIANRSISAIITDRPELAMKILADTQTNY
jgi:glycerophosphoryl diester phosphodiesterase